MAGMIDCPVCARRRIVGSPDKDCPACKNTGTVSVEVDLLARVAMFHMPHTGTVTSFPTKDRLELRRDLDAYFEARER